MGSGDGTIHYRDALAIAQLPLFTLSLLFAYYFRRTRRIGWFCIGLFSLLRIIGAGCMLGTVVKREGRGGLWAGVFVCEGLGVLLLVFVLLEGVGWLNKSTPLVPRWAFYTPQLLTYIDIGISIGSFIIVSQKSHSNNSNLLPTPWSRASTILLLLIFLYTVCLSLYFYLHHQEFTKEGDRLAKCVVGVSPLLMVRVLYSVIFVLTGDVRWNAIKGDPSVYLGMTLVPEVGFVGVCTWVIWGMKAGKVEVEGKGGGEEGEERLVERG